jgi:hypothetical protein
VKAPYITNTTPSVPGEVGNTTGVNTIEPSLEDASLIVGELRDRLTKRNNRRLIQAFTALADGDQAVGLLAFYLWRRNTRRRM